MDKAFAKPDKLSWQAIKISFTPRFFSSLNIVVQKAALSFSPRKIYFYDAEEGCETEAKAVESRKYFVSDCIHVNDDGANLVASVIAEELAKSESLLKNYLIQN